MAFKPNQLGKIPQRKKDLVFGFIKEVYANENKHVPNMVKFMALIYYHTKNDSFDGAHTNGTLDIEKDCVKQPHQELLDPSLMITYLKNIASNGTHIWRFQNNNTTTNDADMLGIKNIESELRLTGYFDAKGASEGYALFMGGLIRRQTENNDNWDFLETWGNGCIIKDSIVEMKLDFNDLSLSFKIERKNDEATIGKAYNIKKGSYRAVVAVHGDSYKCMTLLSYQHIV